MGYIVFIVKFLKNLQLRLGCNLYYRDSILENYRDSDSSTISPITQNIRQAYTTGSLSKYM